MPKTICPALPVKPRAPPSDAWAISLLQPSFNDGEDVVAITEFDETFLGTVIRLYQAVVILAIFNDGGDRDGQHVFMAGDKDFYFRTHARLQAFL